MVNVRDELEDISFGLCLIPLALAVSDEEDLNTELNSELNTELNSEMWGKKGVCDKWEKWACLGGE